MPKNKTIRKDLISQGIEMTRQDLGRKNNLASNFFIILIIMSIILFLDSILILLSFFRKGILKKEVLSKETNLGFDIIIKS